MAVFQDNFNDSSPVAPSGYRNVKWLADSAAANPRSISAYGPNIGGIDARTSIAEKIGIDSQGKLVTLSNYSPIAVTLDSTVNNQFFCAVQVNDFGNATFTPSSGLINNTASQVIAGGSNLGGWLFFDGTDWWMVAGGSGGAAPYSNGGMGITIDGGGSVPSTGSKGFLQAFYDCTVASWTLIGNSSGSAQITVKKSSYSGFPTTTSIVASAPPSLSAVQKNTSSTLTGWTTAISKGDILEFNLDSITTITRLMLALQVIRSD